MSAQIITLPVKATAKEIMPFFSERGQRIKSLPTKGKRKGVVIHPIFGVISNGDDLPPAA